MHWLDWMITLIPILFILGVAFYARRFIRGVADFLAAGRVAGRYVLAVGDLEATLSVVFLASMVEAKYQTGFALAFWEVLLLPLGIVMALSGYCTYRFRATRVLSAGQFLEARYNRTLRVFASTIRVTAEILANAIGPAVAANFFIYFLGLPLRLDWFGFAVPTFALVIFIVLAMAVWIMWTGGRIALLVTDCLQGIISYPVFVIIVTYLLYTFSWECDIAPVMLDRVPGQSFLNPYDIQELRDFNVFSLVYLILFRVIGRANWIGGEASTCGKTPHEQKMAGILGTWKFGFSMVTCIGIAIMVITVLNHERFAPQAKAIRTELAVKVAAGVVRDPAGQAQAAAAFEAIPELRHRIGVDAPLSNRKNLDQVYLETAREHFRQAPDGSLLYQQFRTLYHQVMMAVTLKNMFPVGIMGLFCLLMVMLMLSTDDTRIFNSSSALIQDVILPLIRKPLSPERHVLLLKLASVLVAAIFFTASLFFAQLDYILMYTAIMAGIWNGGAGPVMLGGLYTRWGNTTGAFAAIFVGSGISGGGMLLQRNWAGRIYPFLENMGWIEATGDFFRTVSAPLNPLIVWEINPHQFPVNSYEILFLSTFGGIGAYVVGSLVTYRGAYNLDRLLHRGAYAPEGEKPATIAWSWRAAWGKWIGITPEYTRGDRAIAWSIFIYTIVYQLIGSFLLVIVWNAFSPWNAVWWSRYFLITMLLVPSVVGVISTVWFMWGGIADVNRLFRDLAARVNDPRDDGRVDAEFASPAQDGTTEKP